MPKILLVEDNELNRDMLSRRLQRRGYEVICAMDGRSGVQMAAQTAPDLILMDMSLPDVNGWDATRMLKGDTNTRAIPILGLSAHAFATDRKKAIDAGCDDYDTKPVEIERLLVKIENLLKGAGEKTAPGSK